VSDKFTAISAERANPACPYPVIKMCTWLGVSASGFYEFESAPPSPRQLRRAKVALHVTAAFELGRGTYGVRRVSEVLGRSADPDVASASLRLVRSIMAEEDLHACQPRAYRVTTTQDPDGPADPIADHVHRDFTAEAPGTKLVGDITYISTWQGWLYLATVIDCHNRAVIGWSMADHMRTSLVEDALTMAATQTHLQPKCVFHSDRGSQYTSSDFAKHLKRLDLTGSMGRTGICWDNALAESFFAALKNELVYRTVFATRDQARSAIAEYIEVFYNRIRLHSSLGYRTPAEVANQHHQNSALAA
jgi:putative transposase